METAHNRLPVINSEERNIINANPLLILLRGNTKILRWQNCPFQYFSKLVSKMTSLDMIAFDWLKWRGHLKTHIKCKNPTCYQTLRSRELINVLTMVSYQSCLKIQMTYSLSSNNVVLSLPTCFVLFRPNQRRDLRSFFTIQSLSNRF